MGRSVDLQHLISQRINSTLVRSLEVALSRFEALGFTAIVVSSACLPSQDYISKRNYVPCMPSILYPVLSLSVGCCLLLAFKYIVIICVDKTA